MTQDMKKEPICRMGSDKVIPKHVNNKPFRIRFPERIERKDRFQPVGRGV
jgi:hypothetical protein